MVLLMYLAIPCQQGWCVGCASEGDSRVFLTLKLLGPVAGVSGSLTVTVA